VTDGAFDLADFDFSQPAPGDFIIQEDELPFDAADKDEDAND
jgi:hypothetical protein